MREKNLEQKRQSIMYSDRMAFHWVTKAQYTKQTQLMGHFIWLTKLYFHISLWKHFTGSAGNCKTFSAGSGFIFRSGKPRGAAEKMKGITMNEGRAPILPVPSVSMSVSQKVVLLEVKRRW